MSALARANEASWLDSDAVPEARACRLLARLDWAAAKFARGEAVRADAAAPLYLRDKVALDVNEQAALRAERKQNAGKVEA